MFGTTSEHFKVDTLKTPVQSAFDSFQFVTTGSLAFAKAVTVVSAFLVVVLYMQFTHVAQPQLDLPTKRRWCCMCLMWRINHTDLGPSERIETQAHHSQHKHGSHLPCHVNGCKRISCIVIPALEGKDLLWSNAPEIQGALRPKVCMLRKDSSAPTSSMAFLAFHDKQDDNKDNRNTLTSDWSSYRWNVTSNPKFWWAHTL